MAIPEFRPLANLYRKAWKDAGHPPDDCEVGINTFGLVGETIEEAKKQFFPGWYHMFGSVARERGWAAPSGEQFDAMCGPGGVFLIGDAETVAPKAIAASEALGGVSRISFQLGTTLLAHHITKRSIERLGSDVAPAVRQATGTTR